MPFYKTPSYQTFISRQGFSLVLLALVISLLSSILAYTEKTEGLDWLLYDKAMNLSFLPPADDIVIIDIDNKSISQLGRWPWPRKVHAELLDKLTQAQSKIVVFDVLFPELETGNYQSDLLFAQAIKHHGSVILPIYLETLGQQGQVVENPPHSLFYTQVLALGHAHLHAEADGVIRSVFLKEGVGRPYWPHLSLSLFNNLNNTEISAWTVPGSRAEEPLNTTSTVGIVRDFHNLIPMPSPIQGLRHYSYSDILNGAIDLKNLHEKIIFVGSTASGLGDVLATPVGSMNGVELNAWVFQGLRSDKLIQTLPALNLAILSFVCVLLLVLVLGRLSPRLFLVFSSVAIAVILCVVIMFLLYMNIWLPPISAVVGIVVFFPLWSWLRAESILRFLRQEIEVLSQTTFHQESTPNRQQTAQYFLEQTGILDPVSKQKTQIGELAITALCSEHTQNLDSNFWHKQVQQHSDKESYLPKEYKGIEVIARTISQLSTIKESDRKNRQLIEKSLSSLQDAVCIADLCGEITFTNKRFEQWFQTHQTSLGLLGILKNLELKSGTSWPQALSNLYKTNKLFIEEAILKGTNNQQFLCQASLVSINEAYSDTLILTFTDITELKAAENARAEALSFLSHDLRSPMVSVLAILDRYSSANSSKLSNEAIQDIESLVRKNLDYAESFLQLSKADAFVETNMRPCDLHAVLDAAQVQAMALARPKSIKVVTERCDDDVWVLGDINLLERALNNLISNAVKFSPEGSLLRLSLTKFDQDALLSVEDQGVGIDKCDQASIFDRFIRLKASADTDGAGLGLNFVATVAKKHLGKVSLKSALNLGSTFTMHLPALKEQELFDHFEEKYYH